MGDELMTVAEVARWLRVCRQSVFRWRRNEGLPYLRVGGRVRFVRAEVLAWLEAQRAGRAEAGR